MPVSSIRPKFVVAIVTPAAEPAEATSYLDYRSDRLSGSPLV